MGTSHTQDPLNLGTVLDDQRSFVIQSITETITPLLFYPAVCFCKYQLKPRTTRLLLRLFLGLSLSHVRIRKNILEALKSCRQIKPLSWVQCLVALFLALSLGLVWTHVKTTFSNTFWTQWKGNISSVQMDEAFELDSKYVWYKYFLVFFLGLVWTHPIFKLILGPVKRWHLLSADGLSLWVGFKKCLIILFLGIFPGASLDHFRTPLSNTFWAQWKGGISSVQTD